jgi:hypothetical protein
VDSGKIDALDAIDFLGKQNLIGHSDPRVLFGAITHPDDGTIDDLLEKAPGAVREFLNNNDPIEAQKLLKSLDSRIGGLTKSRNYGYKVEGHHPLSIAGSYLLTSDMPMERAQSVYEILRLNGLNVGTKDEYMLPITRIGHDIAHIDPITHKTNKRGFQGETTRFRQVDPEERAIAYLPMGLLEQGLSHLAFNRPEEQAVRRFAGELISRSPELLYSLEKDPNYLTPTGRQGNISYANSAIKLLGATEMAEALNAGYGSKTMSDIIEPNQYKFEYKSGKKSPEYRDRKNKIGKPIESALSSQRPGQLERMRRIAR